MRAGLVFGLLGGCGPKVGDRTPASEDIAIPSRVASQGDLEAGVLAVAGRLLTDTPTRVGGGVVVAGGPYASASARQCRSLRLESAPPSQRWAVGESRIVCTEGEKWFFVPSIVAASASALAAQPTALPSEVSAEAGAEAARGPSGD